MGKVRFRKSINLGGGVRINVSKKGVGASVGVKGLRAGIGADGKKRVTASIPGTGLSYQHVVGSKPKTRQAAPAAPTPSSTSPTLPPNLKVQNPKANYWLGFVLNCFIPGLGLLAVGRLGWGLFWIGALIILGINIPALIPLIWIAGLVHYHFLFRTTPNAAIQITGPAPASKSVPLRASATNLPDPSQLSTYLNPGEVPPRPGLPVGMGEVGVFTTYQVERNRLADASYDLDRLTDKMILAGTLSPEFIHGATYASLALGKNLIDRFGQDDGVLAEKILRLLLDSKPQLDALFNNDEFELDTQFFFSSSVEGTPKTYIFQADGMSTTILMYPEERIKLGLPITA